VDGVNPKFEARNTKRIQMFKIQNSKPRSSLRLILYFAWVILLLIVAGCEPQRREPEPVFPGKKTVSEALHALSSRSQNIGPLKASGQCLWQYYSEGKAHNENFAVKIWANPPAEVYLQGDIGFNPRGIVLGSNASEFWLLIKPEVSRYSWGKWSEQGSSSGLMFVPKTLGEGLGIVEVSNEKDWSLSKEDNFDVLVRGNGKRGVDKKIYISRRDYLVRKIEYFDVNGEAVAMAELDRYREVSKEFFIPASIKIIMYGEEGSDGSATVRLSLKSVKSESFTEIRRNILFNRPGTSGYKNIYRIINAQIVE